jgi:type VI secretion system protein ImpH
LASADGPAPDHLAFLRFLGLTGPNGPLPLHLTEYARDRARNNGDPTLAAFLDVFHHRIVSLFYRARASAEPALSLDRPDTRPLWRLRGQPVRHRQRGLQERDEIGDFAKLHFAGLMANQRRPAAGLVTILRAYFRLPVAIEQFVGHWMKIPLDGQTRIGMPGQGNRLGSSAVLGARCGTASTSSASSSARSATRTTSACCPAATA